MLGSFLGLLLEKLALGMIFGFFAGIVIDSAKRKAASGSDDRPAEGRENV